LPSTRKVISNKAYSAINDDKLAEQTTDNIEIAAEQEVQAPVLETTPTPTTTPVTSTVATTSTPVKSEVKSAAPTSTTVKPPTTVTSAPPPITTAPTTPNVPDYMTKDYITPSEKMAFISRVAPFAKNEWTSHKILPSLTIAQACLESGYGFTWLSVNGQNFFAIKAGVSWTGATIIMPTKEYNADGSFYIEQATFRRYTGFEASLQDHTNLLLRARYSNIIGVTDYKVATVNIYKDGYATDPNYPKLLQTIIEKYNLTQYDVQAGAV
jgi:flagellum-specific peptidoglycan hydrolase FlgJ